MSEKVSFIIVDDHPTMRVGIKTILERHNNFQSLGEVSTLEEFARLMQSNQPDLIIVDISLGENSGFDIFSSLQKKTCSPYILFISMHIKPAYIIKAVSLGAMGYVSKDSSDEIIYRAALTVSEGHHFFDEYASDSIAKWIRALPTQAEYIQDQKYNQLSQREKDVFVWLAKGADINTISSELYISKKTVMNYRNSIMSILNLDDLLELRAYAEEIGLL